LLRPNLINSTDVSFGAAIAMSLLLTDLPQTQQNAAFDLRQLLRHFTIADRPANILHWSTDLDQKDGSGVRVALLDSGVHLRHSLLKGAQIEARDFTQSGGVFDSTGHGTKGAALLVGQARLKGLAPACTLFVGKVLGSTTQPREVAIAQGIGWAIAQDAQILVLPLGRHQGSRSIKQAIDRALANGCRVFAAAGNYGAEVCLFPARLPGVIAVSAVNLAGVPLAGCAQTQVDCYAPGQDVFPSHLAGGSSMNGSSAATVIAAGVAALRMAQNTD
jgi:subtilisin family serine protease